MAKTVEFLFDFGSPTTYLAYTQVPDLAARCGAAVEWTPVLLGGLFKETGNASPAAIPAKARYMLDDLRRFAARYDVPFTFNPYFPINTLALMRGAVGLIETPFFRTYVDAVFAAMWVEGRDMGDPSGLADVLEKKGIDRADFEVRASSEETKERLKANTQAAVARGAFGAPTFFVGGEMFFGQDRLDFVEKSLRD